MLGNVPFDNWLLRLRDRRGKKRILARLKNLEAGLEGDWKSVGDDVRELRVHEGPGYRVYYAWDGKMLILLLCAGDKATQSQDILTAQRYWRDYHARKPA